MESEEKTSPNLFIMAVFAALNLIVFFGSLSVFGIAIWQVTGPLKDSEGVEVDGAILIIIITMFIAFSTLFGCFSLLKESKRFLLAFSVLLLVWLVMLLVGSILCFPTSPVLGGTTIGLLAVVFLDSLVSLLLWAMLHEA